MALSFDGSTKKCVINSGLSVTAYPFTMACWSLHSDSNQGTCMIFENDSSGGNGFNLIGWDASHRAEIGSGDGAGSTSTPGTSTETNGTWYHICGVFASATDRRISFNGVQEATSSANRVISTPDHFRLAWRENNGGGGPVRKLNGQLAECAIWTATLDTSEIAALGKGFCPLLIRPASLLAYWPLSRGSVQISTTTLDRWRNRSDLTETSTPGITDHPRIIYPNFQPSS